VRQAAAAGQSVVFGDAARLRRLMAAGLARASAVVVTYHDTPSALKILQVVSVRRATGQVQVPDDQMTLSAGDTLVLSGLPEPLALAEEKLLRR
jgi:Trk K+ transport system NAD-binding subunit